MSRPAALVAALLFGGLASACSSSSSAPPDSGAGGDAHAETSDSASNGPAPPTCADFSGTCTTSATAACAAGATEVLDGSETLCGSGRRCCVPTPMAGALTLHGDYGLVCTSNHFTEFNAGTCGGVTCAIGCACTATSAATCDCSRGAPPTHDGTVSCALFDCGVSTCSFGCHCADAKSSACVCP